MYKRQTQINAVQTILANTSSKGTTLDQVNHALDELNHYADMTIYNFTEMTRNIGMFTAAGVDLDTSVAAIKGIANLAAVSGSNSQQESTAMYQLSQALAAGTVKLQDWNSVVNAGMGGQVFQDALKEKLGDNVKFDLQNAQGEQTTAATICNGFVSDGVDLILANATSPLQSAAAATTTIPILGTSVTDYATALEISDWSGATGRNISGTSDLAPIEEQEAMLKELFPDVKQVGLLYCSAEANSLYQIQLFEAALDKDGIAYKEYALSLIHI